MVINVVRTDLALELICTHSHLLKAFLIANELQSQCLKITQKVLFCNIASEASYVFNFGVKIQMRYFL